MQPASTPGSTTPPNHSNRGRASCDGFDEVVHPGALSWSTAHGDLHWANLTNPGCWLLDWESWGSAPAGYDAALLHGASLLQPAIAERVYHTFADILTGWADAVAQLAAATKLLRLVDYGDHPELAVPLHRHARSILATYFPDDT